MGKYGSIGGRIMIREDLAMIDGADKLLDSLGGKFDKVQLADSTSAEIVLSKIEELYNNLEFVKSIKYEKKGYKYSTS